MFKTTYEIVNPEALKDAKPGVYTITCADVELTEGGDLMLRLTISEEQVQ